MDRIVAYCGLVCTNCQAYIASQADDCAALEQIAARWRAEFNAPDITVESVICDGCLGSDGRHCGHCFECEIRTCGMARDIVNCAYCVDYACDKLGGFFGLVPEARVTLDEIRRAL